MSLSIFIPGEEVYVTATYFTDSVLQIIHLFTLQFSKPDNRESPEEYSRAFDGTVHLKRSAFCRCILRYLPSRATASCML